MKRLLRQFLLRQFLLRQFLLSMFSCGQLSSFGRASFAGLLVVASFFIGATKVQAAESGDIGAVIAYSPGASLLRGGVTESLAPNAGIKVSDSITTDAAGRVKILLHDDSSVSLGPNTTVDMSEYADAGSSSALGINLGSGLARIITGKIVEQNPDGFKVSCPHAVIGIRGTIITIHAAKGPDGNDVTTIYVENTLRQVFVNDINVPGGYKIVLPDGTISPITPEDRRFIGVQLAFLGGSGSAAASPEAGELGEHLLLGQRFLAAFSRIDSVDGSDLITQLYGNNLSLAGPQTPVPTVSGTFAASVAGGPGTASGTFSFNVNLTSGAIYNGQINLTSTPPFVSTTPSIFGTPMAPISIAVNVSGLTGTANPAGFSMSGPATIFVTEGSMPTTHIIPNTAGMGSVTVDSVGTDLQALPTGATFPVGYELFDTGFTLDRGTGSGTLTK